MPPHAIAIFLGPLQSFQVVCSCSVPCMEAYLASENCLFQAEHDLSEAAELGEGQGPRGGGQDPVPGAEACRAGEVVALVIVSWWQSRVPPKRPAALYYMPSRPSLEIAALAYVWMCCQGAPESRCLLEYSAIMCELSVH